MNDMEMTTDEYEMQANSPNRDEEIGCNGGGGGPGGNGSHCNDGVNDSRGRKRGCEIEEEINSDGIKDDTKKGRATSKAWQFFEKIKISTNEVYAECKICGKRLKNHYKDGISYLNNHYRKCLQESMGKGYGQKEIPVSVDEHGSAIMGSYSEQDQPKCDMAEFKLLTARMIILHEFPLSLVEYVGFRDLMKRMQPQLSPISRNMIKNEILKMYDVEKEKVVKLLDECDSRIAITTDMWTASHQKKGYMVVTSHYIDSSWVLRSRILRFIYLPAPHNTETICNELHACLMDWNVDRKLSTVTIDNCSTNDAMIDQLLYKLSCSDLILGGSLLHMRCSAHILNLIVRDGMSVMETGVENIRESISYWIATPARMEKFEVAARQLGVKESRKLVLDCKTRWNSTYLMLNIAGCYKDVFARLRERERSYKSCPSEWEWELAKNICDHLHKFYKLTELFSGTQYPTCNLVFPKICDIRVSIKSWLDSPIPGVKDMAIKMIAKYDKYWEVIHGVLAIGTILDPRYKMLLIIFFFPKIYGHDADLQIERIRKMFFDLINEYSVKYPLNVSSSSSSSHQLFQNNNMFDGDTLEEWQMFVTRNLTLQLDKSEVDRYLEENPVPDTSDFNILYWWKNNKAKYPLLSRIAKDFLAIPVTTVMSKSAFSTGGRYLSPHRSRLHPKTIKALMCTQHWYWAELRGQIPMDELITAERGTDYDGL